MKMTIHIKNSTKQKSMKDIFDVKCFQRGGKNKQIQSAFKKAGNLKSDMISA